MPELESRSSSSSNEYSSSTNDDKLWLLFLWYLSQEIFLLRLASNANEIEGLLKRVPAQAAERCVLYMLCYSF